MFSLTRKLQVFLSATKYHSHADYNSRRVGVVAVPTFKNNNDRFALYLEVSCTRVSRFAAYAYVKIRPSQMAQPAYQPKSEKCAYLWCFLTNLVEIWYEVSKCKDSTHVCNLFMFEHANWPNRPTTQLAYRPKSGKLA